VQIDQPIAVFRYVFLHSSLHFSAFSFDLIARRCAGPGGRNGN
jgi:hypothetical protein